MHRFPAQPVSSVDYIQSIYLYNTYISSDVLDVPDKYVPPITHVGKKSQSKKRGYNKYILI